MDNIQEFSPDPRGSNKKLAQWLQQILYIPSIEEHIGSTAQTSSAEERDSQLELLLNSDYHLHFYQQLPDFIMALLNNDAQATTRYAPLLFHIAGCNECHQGYLELYDAMRAAIYPHEPRPILGQGTQTLAATPGRMLAHLCQAWISQAEAILRLAKRDSGDEAAAARLLLQLAIRVSTRITQANVRRQALHDLVRVATLFEAPDENSTAAAQSYTPVLVGGKGVRRRGEIGVPKADTLILQSSTLEGSITQQGQKLELHLRDLDETLRGHIVVISVVLGSLIEPIRWSGGNPHAIRSSVPVDASGAVTLSLGETDLRLSNPEERNLLEATFLLLEIRAAS